MSVCGQSTALQLCSPSQAAQCSEYSLPCMEGRIENIKHNVDVWLLLSAHGSSGGRGLLLPAGIDPVCAAQRYSLQILTHGSSIGSCTDSTALDPQPVGDAETILHQHTHRVTASLPIMLLLQATHCSPLMQLRKRPANPLHRMWVDSAPHSSQSQQESSAKEQLPFGPTF